MGLQRRSRYRLVFEFVKSDGKEDNILLIEIGTHEEVY